MMLCFIIAVSDGCSDCYPCNSNQDTCVEVPGMTLEYAVAISTASRVFALYLMLTCAFYWVYVSPALETLYPPALMHAGLRVLVMAGCILYFLNPPHIEAEHH